MLLSKSHSLLQRSNSLDSTLPQSRAATVIPIETTVQPFCPLHTIILDCSQISYADTMGIGILVAVSLLHTLCTITKLSALFSFSESWLPVNIKYSYWTPTFSHGSVLCYWVCLSVCPSVFPPVTDSSQNLENSRLTHFDFFIFSSIFWSYLKNPSLIFLDILHEARDSCRLKLTCFRDRC